MKITKKELDLLSFINHQSFFLTRDTKLVYNPEYIKDISRDEFMEKTAAFAGRASELLVRAQELENEARDNWWRVPSDEDE